MWGKKKTYIRSQDFTLGCKKLNRLVGRKKKIHEHAKPRCID